MIEMLTKDHRYIKFDFENRADDCENAHKRIHYYAFPENEIHDIFAFHYSFPVANFEQEYLENGWGIWDSEREFNID